MTTNGSGTLLFVAGIHNRVLTGCSPEYLILGILGLGKLLWLPLPQVSSTSRFSMLDVWVIVLEQ